MAAAARSMASTTDDRPDEQVSDAKRELEEKVLAAAAEASVPAAFEDLDEDDEGQPRIDEEKPAPAWAVIPDGLKVPQGWQLWFVQFRAKLTSTPGKGDRHCVLWNLSEADEKLAAKRAKGDPMRIIDECAKQMIRAVDGAIADWSGNWASPGSIDTFWREIGGKARHKLKELYLKNHTMTTEETADFFENCVAVRTAG
jgi:hypothetical protein